MTWQRGFLRSRVARRVLWVMLLAAGVPVALFALLSYGSLQTVVDRQAQQWAADASKFAGLRIHDRLVAARAAFETVVAAAPREADAAQLVAGLAPMFAAVARVDAQGQWRTGDAALVRRWQDATPHAQAALQALPFDAAAHGSAIVMSLPDPGGPGTWLAELDADFLWHEIGDREARAPADRQNGQLCAFDRRGRVLHCPAMSMDAAQARLHADDAGRRREAGVFNLFMRADFGVDDWRIVALPELREPEWVSLPWPRLAATGALATLLMVALLGLVQVRRTLVPLERLIDGTRRLAARDFAARVEVAGGDEFGELAEGFNQLAQRIGRQMRTLEVQAAIDREILGGPDLPRVVARVRERLAELLPQAQACLFKCIDGATWRVRLHHGGRVDDIDLPEGELPPADWSIDAAGVRIAPGEARPAWLGAVLSAAGMDAAGHLWCVPVRAREANAAWLLLAADAAWPHDEAIERDVRDLADRIAVALAATAQRRQLVERAVRDGLTGLLNRNGLHEALDGLLQAAGPGSEAGFSMLFIDLDRFKEVNDTLGHPVGDELLCALARRFAEQLGPEAVLARPGGDEFVVLVPGERARAERAVRILAAALADPVPLLEHDLQIGASIGIVHSPEHGTSHDDLMRRADQAMYHAKAQGRGGHAWYEAAFDARMLERAALLRDLRMALPREQFELHYQPRVDARTRRTRSVEALLRWRHPQRGLVPPTQFVELAEEIGLIEPIGLWVIETACRQLVQWRAAGVALDCVAVNVSTRQLQSKAFADEVLSLVAACGLQPRDLEVEITESVFVGDMEPVIALLAQLRAAGVHIALDDFGTGYSSMSYLYRLPVDVMKVDRSFVKDLGQVESAEVLTRSIVALARALGKRIVAEGVETQLQLDRLVELGADEIQGYYFSKPLAAAQLAARLREGFEPVAAVAS